MSDTATPVAVLAIGADDDTHRRLVSDLTDALGDAASVVASATAEGARTEAQRITTAGGVVPVAFVVTSVAAREGVTALVTLHHYDELADTRLVLVTRSTSLRGVDLALRAGALHGTLTTPWTSRGLRDMLAAQVATHLVEHAPERLAEFDHLVDPGDRELAEQRIAQRRDAPARPEGRPHPLLDDTTDDDAVEAELVAALDRALGHPPRIRIGPNTTMIESGDDVGGIFVIRDGVVRLTSTTDDGEVILHEWSTGAIVGLLSLASRRRALLTCRSVTEVRAIPVTLEQLAHAMDVDPTVAGLLNRVLIASLARRLRRSDILQAELDRSLAALSEARAQLVATARFRTLGELSAGMAHELNNPAAALQRSIDHIADDLGALLDPRDAAVVAAQLTVDPADAGSTELTTSERRALRRELGARFGPQLASRLIELGARDVASAAEWAELDPAELEREVAARRLGTTLRHATRAAHRVQTLVDSLRAYARGDDGRGVLVDDVDVERTLDSAVRLVKHRLGECSVERQRADDLPLIVGRPGALQHVWTNLLTNAMDACDGSGTITIRTHRDGATVVVEVEDDGPGVPAELAERIFEPRFTTKQGRVAFGLGLGLSIARQIVGDHDGTIELTSRPGRTVFSVTLPVDGPANPNPDPDPDAPEVPHV